MILYVNKYFFLNVIKQFIFVMEKGCVLFEVQTNLFYIIQTSFGVKWLVESNGRDYRLRDLF
jgi:hypothetical protein